MVVSIALIIFFFINTTGISERLETKTLHMCLLLMIYMQTIHQETNLTQDGVRGTGRYIFSVSKCYVDYT